MPAQEHVDPFECPHMNYSDGFMLDDDMSGTRRNTWARFSSADKSHLTACLIFHHEYNEDNIMMCFLR